MYVTFSSKIPLNKKHGLQIYIYSWLCYGTLKLYGPLWHILWNRFIVSPSFSKS